MRNFARLALVALLAPAALADQVNGREVPPGTPTTGVKLHFLPDYDSLPPLAKRGDSSQGWKIHDMKRPLPRQVAVPELPSQPAPADALALFDGTQASIQANFVNQKWKAKDGAVVAVHGDQTTRKAFGDCQLHVEWRALDANHPNMCNSGVIFMGGRYEIQIMDSNPCNVIPADGGAAAVYGWMPPLVNPIQPAGKWNTYDIVFHRPRFDAKGACVQKTRVTILFNGMLVQDNTEFPGPTSWDQRLPYRAHADKLPLSLQDHGGGVEFRNVWVRDLE